MTHVHRRNVHQALATALAAVSGVVNRSAGYGGGQQPDPSAGPWMQIERLEVTTRARQLRDGQTDTCDVRCVLVVVAPAIEVTGEPAGNDSAAGVGGEYALDIAIDAIVQAMVPAYLTVDSKFHIELHRCDNTMEHFGDEHQQMRVGRVTLVGIAQQTP